MARTLTLALALAALALPLDARATVVKAATFEELSAIVPVIVRGRVVAQQSRWDDAHRRIQTFTELQVTETLKGRVGPTILVRQPGGIVGDIGQHVSGAARFELGDDVVLFLEHPGDDPNGFIVSGLAAGKVLLKRNALGELRAERDLRGIAFYAVGHDARPVVRDVHNVEDLGTAEQFLARIRAAVKKTGAAR
ncbi:MAG: hypothetical protein IRZ16_03475 [Myxococcaceae bacterium]|nr:hypothetical protein [Myxococcaceae bacterium]